ncbi:class I SAM-dependent methyltransferase family protein [Candidatus Micrarchaeota archaeon]|nr:class I SAM-dependent methyltransferase family protein [Candidatus Micrarchaeota archaeon]
MDMIELLEKRLLPHELKHIKGSFDIIGDVAVVEIPDELSHRERDIVEALLELNPRIKTVYNKGSARKGAYRLRDFKLIYGEEKETEHKEHGFRVRLDVRKVYFSPREATERQRIAKQVKANEIVMVMFAGAGPYALAIAKTQPRVRKVYAVEMNPDAYKYMAENVRINKAGNKIVPVMGDVGAECEKYFGKCDRVVMPLPKGAYEYLKLAAKCLKAKGGTIHYYFWSSEDGVDDIKEIVEVDFQSFRKKIKSLKITKVSEYSPKVLKFCMDIKI